MTPTTTSRQETRSFKLNLTGLIILFFGYFLTTGVGLLDTESFRNSIRILAILFFIINIALHRNLKIKEFYLLTGLIPLLAINQSDIILNIIFLTLITISLTRLSSRNLSIALLISTLAVAGFHQLLLIFGLIEIQSTEFAGRIRTSLGFSNANQVSAIYLSLSFAAAFAWIQTKEKWLFLLLILTYMLTFHVLSQTNTRTAMISLAILVGLQISSVLFFQFQKYRALLALSGAAIPILGSLLTYYLTISTDPILDAQLSLRPYFFSEFVRDLSSSDFLIGWQTPNGVGVDNSYLMMLSAIGAIAALPFLIWTSNRILHMDPRIIPIAIVILTAGVFESFLLRPEIPASVLFAALLAQGRKIYS